MKLGDLFRDYQWLGLILFLSFVAACDRNEKPVTQEQSASATPGTDNATATDNATEDRKKNRLQSVKQQVTNRKKKSAIEAISFDDITFKMDKEEPFNRSMLTKKINDFEGMEIKIRGFILPSFKQDGLTQFVLVRDNMECCFGPGAALYDCIMVQMQPGESASYSVRPVTVEGNFKIQEWKDFDGVIRAIYHLDGKSVY